MIPSTDRAHRRRACLAALSTLTLALFAAASAQAACIANTPPNKPKGPSSKTQYANYNGSLFNILVKPKQIIVPLPAQTPQAGQLLFSTQETWLPSLYGGAQGQAVPIYNCPMGVVEQFNGLGGIYSGNLYRTNISGIVYRVYYAITDQGSYLAPYISINNHNNRGALAYPINGSSQYTNVRTRIDFLATGAPINAGTLDASGIGGRSYIYSAGALQNNRPIPPQLYSVSLSQNITLTIPTCNVSTVNALTINLPDISTTELLAGNTKRTSTELNVTCTSASNSPPTLNITANNVINRNNAVIGNTSTGSEAASNVGLSLWYYNPSSGSFVQPALSTTLTNAGVSIGNTPSNNWRFQLAAAYQKLSDAVKAGKVTGQATLTFNYS